MIYPDAGLNAAIIRLGGSSDFELVTQWLQASLQVQLLLPLEIKGEDRIQAIGYAEALRDILDYMKKARQATR